MNLTLFISCLYAGGAERVTCDLASYLAEKGHYVEILTMSETQQSYELSDRVSVKTLLPLTERKNKFCNTIIRFPRLWKYLVKNRKADAYIVMLPKTTIMLLAFKWLTKAKIIVSERNHPAVYSLKRQYFLKLYAHIADGYVFQTQDAYEWYGKSIKNVKSIIIPNAVNREFLIPLNDVKKKHVIIAVGRLSKQKNFEMLIRAFAKISDKYIDYQLIIYGEGNERENLQQLIQELKLTERVFLPGNVTNIIDKYKEASVFALSSDYEGMPNVLIEAMALGLPCVSTDCPCGGPNFLIKNCMNGILVPVNNDDKFAEALDKILSSQEFALNLGREAINIRDYLNADRIYAQWENFISEILSK